MVWVVIIVMTAAALLFLAFPFFRPQRETKTLDEQDYLAAQLREIEEGREEGYLSPAEADAATLEARRRLLQAARAAEKREATGAGGVFRQLSILLIGAASVGAIALYMGLGDPGLKPAKTALQGAPAAATDSTASIEESIDTLTAHLLDQPDDLDGWLLLADRYAAQRRFADAADALAKASALAPDRAFLFAAHGEALTMANGGVVTDEAMASLQQALALDPAEPRARFYSALGLYQHGDKDAALKALVALANDAPAGAPWAETVRQEITSIADDLGRPLDDLPLTQAARAAFAPQRGPTEEQMAAAQTMSDEDRAKMIEGMVAKLAARLEQKPDDLEGWVQLGRSYRVLGKTEDSARAFAKAVELAPDDLSVRLAYAEELLSGLDVESGRIDDETAAALREVERLKSDQPVALYFLGLYARQEGDKAKAADYWRQLLTQMPPESKEAASLKKMIEQL